MAKRILILGASGFVGMYIYKLAKEKGFEVLGCESKPKHTEFVPIEITDFAAVRNVIQDFKPDWIVNAAAISNIDFAEANHDITQKVNVDANENIAKVCNKLNIKFLFISSDAVFAGNQEKYSETDAPNPVNFYGQTKAEAENVILKELPLATIIRISMVIGFPIETGNSFLTVFTTKIKNGIALELSTTELRTPIEVSTLAEVCIEIVQKNISGIWHIGATDAVSRYELGMAYAQWAGLDSTLVKKAASQPSNKAPRHQRGVLDVTKAQKILQTPMLSTQEFIRKIVNQS